MAYFRILTAVQEASLADFSDAINVTAQTNISDAISERHSFSIAASATRTISLAGFTTVTAVVVTNTSAADSLTVVVTNAASGAVSQVVAAGKSVTLADVKVSPSTVAITANTSTQTGICTIVGQ